MAVTRPIRRNQPRASARGDVRQGCEVMTRSRRTVKREHRRTVTNPELDPRQLATILERHHTGIGHGAQIARPGTLMREPIGSHVSLAGYDFTVKNADSYSSSIKSPSRLQVAL